ncbi:hypothetical protein CO101_01980, partial [Candidatus Berkelbacteria bacterium CG_4_9_14_3_um_filter_39_23]
ANFGRRASFTGTKFGGGGKRSGESEGGQKLVPCHDTGFLPPNPLPFCPPERSVLVLSREARQSIGVSFKMSSDFFQQTPKSDFYYKEKTVNIF